MSRDEAEARRWLQELCDDVYYRYSGYSVETVMDALRRKGFSGKTENDLRNFALPISNGERLRF